MIKKILTIACSLVLCIVCLTGCSWLEIDRYKYYNDVVVSVGKKNFYKKDLVEAFSNYGYQYYESQGLSLKESINSTIGTMIDRWLLLEEVKSDKNFALKDEEILKIKQEAFDYMQDSIFTYETQVREEWDMTVEEEESSGETASSLRTAEEEYTPSTYYEVVEETVDGVTKLVGKVFRSEEDVENNTIISVTKEDHFNKSRQVVTDKKVSDEAWTRYVKSLQDSAKGEGRSIKEADVLLHEENRLIELLTNNYYLEKYEEAYFDNLPVDVDTVLEYYRTQYNAEKEKYTENESLYHTAMESASSTYVYYHPNSGNEYVNVKHILINFTDAQKSAIDALDTEYDITNDGSDADEKRKENATYQARLWEIVCQTKSTFEMTDENGNVETKTWNALVGEDNIYDYVTGYVTGSTLAERCSQFNELVYIFNDDTGFMNSEFDYVVNLDTSITDKMVKPFADGVRALDESNGGEGAGSIDYIVSEYGIHIIFHAGNARNLVEENINNDAELLRILCNTYTTPESNKSIFNYIYDTLKLDENKYNNMTQAKINTLRTNLKNNGIEITYYVKNYEDLWS